MLFPEPYLKAYIFLMIANIFRLRFRRIAEGRTLQREPHAGGGEQRGQDQRGDQKTERAVAEGLSLIHILKDFKQAAIAFYKARIHNFFHK